ncbi:MAG TPA: aminotransferase class I/II-fold pyridoxal phosphate-dependent enzyme [Puia sp.]|nr:aminotransferase class I/II-fold pyridoxal phosphate-dependent enzyme [Puia sp.]
MITTSKRLDGIGEYYFSTKLREIDELNSRGKKVINLGIGSPDLPPHPEVIEVLQQESQKPNVHAYQGYRGSLILRKAISDWYKQWYGVDVDANSEILPLMGSKEGIVHVCMSYFDRGDRVFVPDPGYPTYSSAVRLSGAEPVYYSLKEETSYFPDFTELKKIIDGLGKGRIKAMFINYPHMPTGQLPTRELFSQLVAFAYANDLLLIHDNPYSFILNSSPMSLLSIPGAKNVVIELNSLSKSHNMAGWRLGMLLATQQRLDEILRFKSNMDSGMFLPIQLAGAKALSLGTAWYEKLNDIYRARREKAFALLDQLACRFERNQAGMFVWAKIPDNYPDCYAISDEILYNAGVFVTPGGIFGNAGARYIRVSLCTPEEKFLESSNRILDFQARKNLENV